MEKFKHLTAGVYAGFNSEGNYGWLLINLQGGSVFFISGFTKGLIKHNQIDQYVARIERELDPENDADEFRQLHSLIKEIGLQFPNILPILDDIKKIVQAFSFFKYNDPNKIQFPKAEEFNSRMAKLLLKPVLNTIEKNSFGRTYRIIEYQMLYKGVNTYAAIIPNKGLVVAPVALASDQAFIATPDMPQDEMSLFSKMKKN